MKNYKLVVQYDGSRYHGWQGQGNTRETIQGKLTGVLSALDGAPVEVQGAGRTDAGVHAKGQAANVHLASEPDCGTLLDYCAAWLPRDIAVISAQEVPDRFHARLNARGKCYEYRIWTSPIPNVFERKYLCSLPEPLDVPAMVRAAQLLEGRHDFRSFCGLRRYDRSTVRTLTEIRVEQLGQEVRLTFQGDGFLNLMVRILTGTLVEVGLGVRTAEEMPQVLAALDRSAAGRTMPPEGLCLVRVDYE